MMDKGLSDLLAVPADRGSMFSSEVWLRNLLLHGLAQRLQRLVKVPLGQAEESWASDLGEVSLLLQTLFEKSLPLGELLADVKAVTALTKGGGSASHNLAASEIREALHTITTVLRFEVLKTALHGTELGKTLLSGCSVLLQLGAKDQAANIKLNRALEILQEGSMPQAKGASEADEGDAEATVSNFDAVKDMAVCESTRSCCSSTSASLTSACVFSCARSWGTILWSKYFMWRTFAAARPRFNGEGLDGPVAERKRRLINA